jgi:hypothetical protein
MMLVIWHDAGHNETDEGSDGRVLAFEVAHEMVTRSQGNGGSMQVKNRTGRTVWMGLYNLNDHDYWATTFPWGARKKLDAGTTGTFTPHADRQQIVFWTSGAFGDLLNMPKAVLTTEVTLDEDSVVACT